MLLRININGNRVANRLALIHLLKIRGIPYAPETDRSIIIDTPANIDNDRNGINWIDMKPFFAMSSKAKQNKDPRNPGWHLVVPIKPTYPQLVHDLSSNSLQQILNMSPGETISVNDLSNLIPHVTNPENYTNNVSTGKSDMETILFRTVSSRSAPNSWVTISNSTTQQNQETSNIKTINLDDSNPDVNLDLLGNNEGLANEANPLVGRQEDINAQLNTLFNNPDISNSTLGKLANRDTPGFFDPTHQMSLF